MALSVKEIEKNSHQSKFGEFRFRHNCDQFDFESHRQYLILHLRLSSTIKNSISATSTKHCFRDKFNGFGTKRENTRNSIRPLNLYDPVRVVQTPRVNDNFGTLMTSHQILRKH